MPYLNIIMYLSEDNRFTLYQRLSDLNSCLVVDRSDDWATREGLYTTLDIIFKESVHLIHPNLSSEFSPANKNDISGVVNYLTVIEKFIKTNGQVSLEKPIIAIWEVGNFKTENSLESQTTEGIHWQTLVIIPKNYNALNGKCLKNKSEMIFFKDPYFKKQSLSATFLRLLKKKERFYYEIEEEIKKNILYEIGGYMPKCQLIENSLTKVQQQSEKSDSGWWSIYNIIMFLFEGSCNFLGGFEDSNYQKEKGYKLRGILKEFGFDLTNSIVSDQNFTKIDKKLIHEFYLYLRNKFLNKLKLKDSQFYNTVEEKIKKMSLDYLIGLSFASKNFDLEHAFGFVSKIMEEDEINIKSSSVSYKRNNIQIKNMNQRPEKDFCIGRSSFEMIVVNSSVFVDKTLFIRDFLSTTSIILLTRPRRWGKSINMDMLKTFLEIDVDKNGTYNLTKGNKNINLFIGGTALSNFNQEVKLNPLRIATELDGYFIKEYQGKFPVIFLRFSQIEETIDEPKTFVNQSLISIISEAYSEHEYIYKSYLVNEITSIDPNANITDKTITSLEYLATRLQIELSEDMKLFKAYKNKDPKVKLRHSLFFLTKLIYGFFGKKVFVIIDEYDAPLNASIGKDYFTIVFNYMKLILKEGLKDNDKFLRGSIITGILPLMKGSLDSGLNNLEKCSVEDNRFSEHFGFTQIDVDLLLDACIEETGEDKLNIKQQIKDWFNGYMIGGQTIYNPWSIMKCLNDYQKKDPYLKAYWIETTSLNILQQALQYFKDFEMIDELLKNKRKEYSSLPNLTYDHIETNSEAFFYLLLQYGYLTIEGKAYVIPNKETELFYGAILTEKLKIRYFNNKIDLNVLIPKIMQKIENVEKYKKIIQKKILDHLQPGDKTESDFQGILTGIAEIALISKKDVLHFVKSELSTEKKKRLNNIFFPIQNKSDIVIIQEYKKKDTSYGIENTIEEALWQIYVNKYIDAAIPEKSKIPAKMIFIRAIVFFWNNLTGKWHVEMKEFRHNIEQAFVINNLFSTNQEILINSKDLINNVGEERLKFLGLYDVSTLCDLLEMYSTNISFPKKRRREKSL